MGGEIVSYLLEHKVVGLGAIVVGAIVVYLLRQVIEDWFARRRQQPSAETGDRASDGSVVQRTSVGDVNSEGGNVEIGPRIDKR
jgi:hypothetical protein